MGLAVISVVTVRRDMAISFARSCFITGRLLRNITMFSCGAPTARWIHFTRPFSMNEILTRRPHEQRFNYSCNGHGKSVSPVMVVPMARSHLLESLRWIYILKRLASPRRYCKNENQSKYELSKFTINTPSTDLEKWLFFIKNSSKMMPEEVEKFTKNDNIFKHAFEELKFLNFSEDEYLLYEAQLKQRLDDEANKEYRKGEKQKISEGKRNLKKKEEDLKKKEEDLKKKEEDLKKKEEDLKMYNN